MSLFIRIQIAFLQVLRIFESKKPHKNADKFHKPVKIRSKSSPPPEESAEFRFVRRQFARGFADSAAKRTSHETVALPCSFHRVRFWYANNSSSPLTLTRASWSPTSSFTAWEPKDSRGVMIALRPVTFDGGRLSLTIPPGSKEFPHLVCSDWMNGEAISRLDGNKFPLVIHRGYYDGFFRPLVSAQPASDLNAFNAVDQGMIWRGGDAPSDKTALPLTKFGPTPRLLLYGIEVMTRMPAVTVTAIGDSLSMGMGSTSGYLSWCFLAATGVSTPDRPVSFLQGGWAGQKTADFIERGRQDVERFQPQIVFLSVWSPNDNLKSRAVSEYGYTAARTLAKAIRSYGGIPILCAPVPSGRITTMAVESNRTRMVERVRALKEQGWLVADLDAVVSDGGEPARLKPEYDCGDGTHLSDAGYEACAREAAKALRTALLQVQAERRDPTVYRSPPAVSVPADPSHDFRIIRRQFARTFADSAAKRTSHETVALPCRYHQVRFWYANNSPSPITLARASWSATSNALAWEPQDAEGLLNPLHPVTFDGGQSALTIAAGLTGFPTLACSDWMAGDSVERLDGSAFPLLVHRGYYDGFFRPLVSARPTLDLMAFGTVDRGMIWRCGDASSDQTNVPFAEFTEAPRMLLYGVEVMTKAPAVTVTAIGDSLSMGMGSESGFAPWCFLAAAAVSTPDNPVSFLQGGWAGQTTIDFIRRGHQDIERFKPEIVFISVWSPNDNLNSRLGVEEGYAAALVLARAILAYDGVPILCTPIPTSRIASMTGELNRTKIVGDVRALAGEDWLIADLDAAVTDGATPARLKAEYDCGDGTHMSDAGYAACAREAGKSLQRAMLQIQAGRLRVLEIQHPVLQEERSL